MPANPNWESLAIQIPGQDLLEGARNILETLMVYLEVLKAVLETVKVFLVDFGNPIKALVEILIQQILQVFNSLHLAGVYGWFDVPNPLIDPNFNRHVGGFPAFLTRFKAGLYDSRDPNRPQPIAGADNGGFLIIVADAESQIGLVRLIQVLLKFLGKEFLTPQYASPANFKVLPVGSAGDPILSIARVFQEQPTSIVIEWSLPITSVAGDPGFSDLVNTVSFMPPRFLIEKSEVNPSVTEVDISDLGDPNATGQVVASVATKFESRGKPGNVVNRTVRLNDSYGDPMVKFQKYIVIDTSTNTGTFILGQLGTFRYIDNDVEVGKTYYYRVRAYSGSLDVSGTNITFPQPQVNVIDSNPFIEWPGDGVVMGKASPVTPIRIPVYPPQFDVIETLKRLFQTSFSLNFHLPMPEGARFDANGIAIEPYARDSDIGKNSLTSLAGPLTSFQAIPLVGDAVSSVTDVTAAFQVQPATGRLPEMPWNDPLVQQNSARLATIVAGAMLQSDTATGFKNFMEGPFPKGNPSVPGLTVTNLADLVYEITDMQDPTAAGQGGVQDAGILYGNVWGDPTVRLNVLAAVNYCKSFTLGGAPPDWIQVSILRDIVPWSGQLLYDLLAKMQGLLDAYSGVIDELKAFIDLIVRKIDTLEQFLEYLLSILNFVDSLSLGFYVLGVPSTGGDVGDWIQLIDNAGGTPPPSGPGGYTGGVAFAYVAPDVTAFANAFSLIF